MSIYGDFGNGGPSSIRVGVQSQQSSLAGRSPWASGGPIGVQGSPDPRGGPAGNEPDRRARPIGVYEGYIANRPQSPATVSQQRAPASASSGVRNPYAGTIHDINRTPSPSPYASLPSPYPTLGTPRPGSIPYGRTYQVDPAPRPDPSAGRPSYQPNANDWRYIQHSKLASQHPALNIRTDVRWS